MIGPRFQLVVSDWYGKLGSPTFHPHRFCCVHLLTRLPYEAHAAIINPFRYYVVENLAFLGRLFAWRHGLAQGFESGVEAVQGGVEVVCAGGVVGVYGEPDDLRPEVEKLF